MRATTTESSCRSQRVRQLRYLRRLRGREAQLVQPVHNRQVLRQGLPAEALEGGRAQKGMLRRAMSDRAPSALLPNLRTYSPEDLKVLLYVDNAH